MTKKASCLPWPCRAFFKGLQHGAYEQNIGQVPAEMDELAAQDHGEAGWQGEGCGSGRLVAGVEKVRPLSV
jgi:hypothetical protein